MTLDEQLKESHRAAEIGVGAENTAVMPESRRLDHTDAPKVSDAAILEGFVRETAAAMLNGRNTIVALRELAEKSAKAGAGHPNG